MWLLSSLLFVLFFASTQSLMPMKCRRSLHPTVDGYNTPNLRRTISSPPWPHGKCFSSSSSFNADDQLQEVKVKVRAVEYCLDNFGNITVPTDGDLAFAKLIRRYDSADKATLVALLKELLQEQNTILLASQIPMTSNGKRMNDMKYACPDLPRSKYFCCSCHLYDPSCCCCSIAYGNSVGCYSSRFGRSCELDRR